MIPTGGLSFRSCRPSFTPQSQTAETSPAFSNSEEVDKETGLVSEMMETLREELKELLPDFAERKGYDGKAIDRHSAGQAKREAGKTSDPDADWGKHKTVYNCEK